MQLLVFTQGAFNGMAHYGIEAKGRITGGKPRPRNAARLRVLAPRIRAMAKRQLGADFKSLGSSHRGEVLILRVTQGTSRGEKHFAFRSLVGWIHLFDAERPAQK